ncbi:MAG: hypothetical protein VB118_09950 [Oscillospiraceae bacterium]|nr:hypothetical protein [Oscillospiraceae bacterium]
MAAFSANRTHIFYQNKTQDIQSAEANINTSDAFEYALRFLPENAARAVSLFENRRDICEIRLREMRPVSLSMSYGNIFIDIEGQRCTPESGIVSSQTDIARTVNLLCEGSVYRHIETIRNGYIITPGGIRAGLCGESFPDTESGRFGMSSFTGINIRIPRYVRGASDKLVSYFRRHQFGSILIFSPPGAGKTTVLRDFAIRLSRGDTGQMKKVAVIDERKELFPPDCGYERGAHLLDVLGGYKKATGIEIASRVLSPDVIVCDEIGAAEDPEALISAHRCGVSFVASAHAVNIKELISKPNIKCMFVSGSFEYYASINHLPGEKFRSEINVYPADDLKWERI